VAQLTGDDQGFHSVTWSPDGTHLAAASDSGEIFVWDWQQNELLGHWQAHPRAIRSLAWSPDGNWLASGSEDHVIRIWRADTGELTQELLGHTHFVTAVRWDHNSAILASVSNDQTLRLWSAKDGRQLRVLRGHTDQIACLDWNANDETLVSAGLDHELKLWDATTELESFTYRGHAGAQSCAAVRFGPRSNRIASVAADHAIHIWEPDTGSRLHELTGHTAAVTSITWHPSGDKLVSSSADGTIWIWNTRSGVPMQKVMKSPSGIMAIAFDHAGKYLAAAAGDGTCFVLDAETLKELAAVKEHRGSVRTVTWHPTAPLLATGGDDREIVFWNVEENKLHGQLTSDAAVLSLDWSPDGKQLASGGDDFKVVIWDLARKEPHLQLLGHSDLVKAVSWSTDGLRLATSSVDGTLRIWDTEVGAEAMTLRGHDKAIDDVDWGSDGMRLASASEDATVRIWNAFTGYEDQRSKDLLPVLNRRIQENPGNVTDLELRRRLLLYHGMVDEARQDRQRIIELYDHQIENDHFLEGVAEKLSAILLESDDEWQVIVPDEAKSQEGATLIPQPDQSIIVEGFNPDWDKYTVTGTVHGKRVTAVRLEAIPDPRLPGGGSGRFSGTGNFHLSEIRARGLLSSNLSPAELYFLRAVADFSSSQSPVENAIDDDLATTWDIWPSQTDRHIAVFELGEPWELLAEDRASLEVTLEFHHPFWMSHNLGRFRISVTESPRPVLREQLRVSLASSRIDGRVRLAGAYYLAGEVLKAEQLLASVPDETEGDNGYAVVLRALISRELDREDAPQLRRDASEWIRLRSTREGRAVPLQLPE
jgi:WD40 repeat protein